ncbi:MAG: DUF4363 family protein [Clostridiales bacterium]|nr:DUF4363 family protein [Clostridiales bacterium]
MVRSIISMLCVAVLLVVGAIFESRFINNQFDDFHDVLEVLYEKIDDKDATQDDVYAVQENWLNKKKNLHAFIPHTEIKEVDLWLAETVTLVRDKEWTDAISKVEVLIELSEQIPKTFRLAFENIL